MPNLLVCMTPGVGLNAWKETGTLDREIAPYIEYVKRGWKVRILTFDKTGIPGLPRGIEPLRFPGARRLPFLPRLANEAGRWADVIKTNQSVHAYFYVRAAKKWRRPILLRCGYVCGEYLETTRGRTPSVLAYQALEKWAFRHADHCFVPTHALSVWVQKRYGVVGPSISVVPNFVDTALFKPWPDVPKMPRSVLSVGRLTPVKRFDLLVRSCALVPGCTVTIAGEGAERERIRQLAGKLNVRLDLPGNILNRHLPETMARHEVFVSTSLREGHPKALLEAMACGLPCVAMRAPGIDHLLPDEMLVDGDQGPLGAKIAQVLDDVSLRARMGTCLSGFVRDRFCFAGVIDAEIACVETLSGVVTKGLVPT